MAAIKKMKKAQGGATMDPRVAELLKKRKAADTTKPYNQEEMLSRLNKQTLAEMKNPKLGDERRRKEDSTKMANYKQDTARRYAFHRKEGDLVEKRPSGSTSITIMPKKKNDRFKNGGKAKDGKWMQKVSKSIKARGTEGKCTPITKPGCTGRAKALAKTFKKIAAKRKAK